MTEPTTETPTPPTADEILESLTGFDEIAIEEAFGAPPLELTGTRFLRALWFIEHKRGGMKHAEAKRAVLEKTMREVNDRFDNEAPEPMPEEPVTEVGKDDSGPA